MWASIELGCYDARDVSLSIGCTTDRCNFSGLEGTATYSGRLFVYTHKINLYLYFVVNVFLSILNEMEINLF